MGLLSKLKKKITLKGVLKAVGKANPAFYAVGLLGGAKPKELVSSYKKSATAGISIISGDYVGAGIQVAGRVLPPPPQPTEMERNNFSPVDNRAEVNTNTQDTNKDWLTAGTVNKDPLTQFLESLFGGV